MQSIKSRLIDGFIYDETTNRLTLYMANGHRRVFVDVPDNVVGDLIAAESPGAYYLTVIKRRFKQAE